MRIEEFLSGSFFRYLIFPVASAILGIMVKYATRNDRYSKFQKEDLAIGLDLIRTACLMYILLSTDRAIALVSLNDQVATLLAAPTPDIARASFLHSQAEAIGSQISSAGWSTFLLFMTLWAVSTIVRKWGWKSNRELKPIPGIAIPLSLGILSLIMVMLGASS
jgi:hypothetical protein